MEPPHAPRIPWIRLALAVVLAAPSLAGCSRDAKSGRLELPAAPAPEPAADPASRIVTVLSTLRSGPEGPGKPKGPPKGTTALAVLQRGERVLLLEARDAWSRVRASDGTEGWLHSAALVPASEVQEGTVLVQAWAFDRPDLLAANARRKLEPGTLLLVRRSRDLFTEVDAGPGGSTWILTDRLTTRPDDVAAAKLVEKARLVRRGDRPDDARELLALLRSRQPTSPLVPVLAAELGEEPPAGAVSPSGSPGALDPAGSPGPGSPVPGPPPAPSGPP